MAESAFEKLASAEAEAEKIRQTGAENQREHNTFFLSLHASLNSDTV